MPAARTKSIAAVRLCGPRHRLGTPAPHEMPLTVVVVVACVCVLSSCTAPPSSERYLPEPLTSGSDWIEIRTTDDRRLAGVDHIALIGGGKLAIGNHRNCSRDVYDIADGFEWSSGRCIDAVVDRLLAISSISDTVVSVHRLLDATQVRLAWNVEGTDSSYIAEVALVGVPMATLIAVGVTPDSLFLVYGENAGKDEDRSLSRQRYTLFGVDRAGPDKPALLWTMTDSTSSATLRFPRMTVTVTPPYQGSMSFDIARGTLMLARRSASTIESTAGDTVLNIGGVGQWITPQMRAATADADLGLNGDFVERDSIRAIMLSLPAVERVPIIASFRQANDGSIAVQRADYGVFGAAFGRDSTVIEVYASGKCQRMIAPPAFELLDYDGEYLAGSIPPASAGNEPTPEAERSARVIVRPVRYTTGPSTTSIDCLRRTRSDSTSSAAQY